MEAVAAYTHRNAFENEIDWGLAIKIRSGKAKARVILCEPVYLPRKFWETCWSMS
ncbi:hypothetical protein MASR1M36_08110 [Candidatus Cloacimonadaceae bacterium]